MEMHTPYFNTNVPDTKYWSCTLVVVSSSHQSPSSGVRRFWSEQSITILLSVLSALKGSLKGGGRHKANDHSRGNGCTLSGRFSSCTDQGFGCDRCAVVSVWFLSSLAVSVRL